MKREQLDKVNRLLEIIHHIGLVLENKKCHRDKFIIKNLPNSRDNCPFEVEVDRDILEPFILNYCEQLKAELKDLEYEEE